MSAHEHEQTETLEQWLDRTRRTLARDLREVGQLTRWLRVEAWHRHSDRVLPGGDALVMLSPTAASWAAYDREVNRAEAAYYADRAAGFKTRWPEIYDLDSDPAPPLLVLASWVDVVRKERGLPASTLRATVAREIDQLRAALTWMTTVGPSGLPHFDPIEELARDIAQLRRRLEAVLHDTPDDHSVPCIRCTGDERGRLHPVWGESIDGEADRWHCLSCGAWLSREDYRRALMAAHRLTATHLCASDLRAEYGVNIATVRKWAERGQVRKGPRDASGRVTYDVEDVLARMANDDDGRFRAASEA